MRAEGLFNTIIFGCQVESSPTIFISRARAILLMPFLSLLIFLLLPLSILLLLLPLPCLSLRALSIFAVKSLLLLIVFPSLALVPFFPSTAVFFSLRWPTILPFPLPFRFLRLLFFVLIMFPLFVVSAQLSIIVFAQLSIIVSAQLSIIFSITIYFYLLGGVEGRLIPLFLGFLAYLRFRVILYLAETRRWADVYLGGWLWVFRVIDCHLFHLLLASFWHNTVFYLKVRPFADSAHFEELIALQQFDSGQSHLE